VFDDAVDAERSPTPLPTYGRSCEAMRDTTKWILSFLPGAALIVTLAGVVPDVAALRPSDRTAPTAWLLAAAGLIGVATALAVWVLAANPPGWEWIARIYAAETAKGVRPATRSFSEELDGSGVLQLFGYRKAAQFFAAITQEQKEDIKAALGAGGTILDFAYLRDLRRRFVIFVAIGAVAATGAVVCIAIARAEVADTVRDTAAAVGSEPPTVGAPLEAQVFPTAAGLRRLRGAGCSGVTAGYPIAAWVVAGSIADGTVILASDSCQPVVLHHWIADKDGVVVPSAS
jgi:hypothetical protein